MSQQKSDLENYEQGDSKWPIGLVLASTFFAGLYGFFNFGYADDPDTCLANNKDDIIANFPMIDSERADSQGQVDVAERYHFFFGFAFYLSVCQVLIGLLALCQGAGAAAGFKSLLVRLYKFTWFLLTIDWILVAFFRF